MRPTCTLTIPEHLWVKLRDHLFPGDDDEHGAVIAAGVARSGNSLRLLARTVIRARDGEEYVPGERGYRMLTASFVRDQVLYCRDEKLAYVAVHNHTGWDRVEFSEDDLASHERGYPALLAILRGQPAGAVVFAERAAAGDIWLPDGARVHLSRVRVVGSALRDFYPSLPQFGRRPLTYDRQARLFGDSGQDLLRRQTVGVIGAGGVGSLLIEYLARLGVGRLLLVDPDRIEISNLSRVVGATRADAASWLVEESRPTWVRRVGGQLAKPKVEIARRVARAANPTVHVEAYAADVVFGDVAARLTSCDYLFLAADSMQARLVFNAMVQQYLIPGIQVGAKVPVDKTSGRVKRVFSVSRAVIPGRGCLWCNGLISPERLQEEALDEKTRKAQRYVEDEEVIAPSVITLNAVAASYAANEYLFRVTGLRDPNATEDFVYFEPLTGNVRFDQRRQDPRCTECGNGPRSRLARGDAVALPTKSR